MKRTNAVSLTLLVLLLFSCADYNLLDNNNPPPAATLAVSGVRDSTVTIHWSLCTDENFASYRIYYDTTDVVDKSSTFVDSLLFVGDTIKTVSNLKPASRYYIRVFTRTLNGKENGSNTVVAVTQLAFRVQQKAGDSGVIISWSPLRKISFDGFRIYYDTTDNVDTTDRKLNSGNMVASSDSTLLIGQIPLGVTWRCKVFAMAGDSIVTSTSGIQNVPGWWFNLYAPDMLSDSTVMLRWSRPRANAGVSEFRIFAAADLPLDTTDTLVGKLTVTDTSKLLFNMAGRGMKYFRVFARGANGYIGSSQTVAYTALSPSKLTVGEIRDTTIAVRWTRCTDGNFSRYKVYCDTSANVGTSSILIDSILLPQDTIRIARGLKPASFYYFRVATLNTSDKAVWSNTVSGISQMRFKPMTQLSLGDSTVSLGWTPLKGIVPAVYRIYRDSLSDKVDTTDVVERDCKPTDSTCSIANIPLGESRRYKVYARSDTGILSTTTTIATINGWWFDFKSVDMRSDTTVMLHWTKPKAGVLQYKIFVADAASVDTADSCIKTVSGTLDSVLIRLTIAKGSTKLFKVFTYSDTGYIGWSRTISYTPLAASTLTISNVRDTSALVQWSQCRDVNFSQYRIYWDTLATVGNSGRSLDTFTFPQDTIKVVNGLRPATLNFFRVVTVNQQGWMAWSAPASVITPIQFRSTQNIGDSVMQVRWTPLHGVSPSSYKIYRDTANSTDTADDIAKSLLVTDSTSSVAKIPLGQSQRFRIVARADTGVLVTTSTVLTVAGRWFDQYTPTGQGDTVVLKWPSQSSNVKSYTIFSGQTGSVDTNSVTLADNVIGTTKIITGLAKSSTSYYRIYAKSDTGYVGSSPVKKYTAP